MKVNQTLLEQIILEVIERLTVSEKPQLLLVHNDKPPREQLDWIVSELQEHWQIRLVNGNDAEGVDDHIEWLFEGRFVGGSVDSSDAALPHIAFLDADQDVIVRGALGLTDTPASRLLASALREGCTILIQPSKDMQWLLGTDDQAVIPARATRYHEHLFQYKNRLVEFGAWFGMVSTFRPSELRLNRKLLTEKDIHEVDASEIRAIRVTSSTIITHLARDAARQKGILIRVDEESSSCK